MPEKAPREEVEIASLSSRGEGVARLADGRVVFVPFTAPGDRVIVRLEEDHGRWARAQVESLESPGPGRCEPPCPAFGDCGGCSLQHIEYAAQVAAKEQILADALLRIGGIEAPGDLAVVPSPAPYGYRGRTRVRVAEGRVGYRRASSHELCAVDSCPILLPKTNEGLATLARRSSEAAQQNSPLPAGDWEITAGEAPAARLWPLEARIPEGGESDAGSVIAMGEKRFRVSPGVFTQVNALLLEPLSAAVVRAASTGTVSRDFCLELYAGAGFLTVGLATAFRQVVAVESNPRAAADLDFNVQSAQQSHVQVHGVAAESVWEELEVPVDSVVVVDPPRQGLFPEVLEQIAGCRPARVVYLSCDPATLARDLKRFRSFGFEMKQVQGFDLFPQTAHLETLAVIERTAPESRPIGDTPDPAG